MGAGNEDVIREMREVTGPVRPPEIPRPPLLDLITAWADRLEASGCGGGEPSEEAVERMALVLFDYAESGFHNYVESAGDTDLQATAEHYLLKLLPAISLPSPPGPEALSSQEAEAALQALDGVPAPSKQGELEERAIASDGARRKLRAIAAGEGER